MNYHSDDDPPIAVIVDGARHDQDFVHIETSGHGPLLVMGFDTGYGAVAYPLRDLLTWCLGPGREALAQHGLVILGGTVVQDDAPLHATESHPDWEYVAGSGDGVAEPPRASFGSGWVINHHVPQREVHWMRPRVKATGGSVAP